MAPLSGCIVPVPGKRASNQDSHDRPHAVGVKIKSPLPPDRLSNNLKRKLNLESVTGTENAVVDLLILESKPSKSGHSEDEAPTKDWEERHLSRRSRPFFVNSWCLFTFDSIADTKSTQVDIFQHNWSSCCENCLTGFSSSVFMDRLVVRKVYTILRTNLCRGREAINDQQKA
ncbi:Kinesin motor domain containing protein, expressed [Datura stramonium]|uniref:Kinesin motor domain containing protein, expressed n=1 Tax=Datura stramonium TaxID=4076 RepID=A0ABS8V4W3_DATST|nr:Kinesin motor domain containing protein, expressed [Datura stramonium]